MERAHEQASGTRRQKQRQSRAEPEADAREPGTMQTVPDEDKSRQACSPENSLMVLQLDVARDGTEKRRVWVVQKPGMGEQRGNQRTADFEHPA